MCKKTFTFYYCSHKYPLDEVVWTDILNPDTMKDLLTTPAELAGFQYNKQSKQCSQQLLALGNNCKHLQSLFELKKIESKDFSLFFAAQLKVANLWSASSFNGRFSESIIALFTWFCFLDSPSSKKKRSVFSPCAISSSHRRGFVGILSCIIASNCRREEYPCPSWLVYFKHFLTFLLLN